MSDLATRGLAIALVAAIVTILPRAISGSGSAQGLSSVRYSKGARFFAIATFVPPIGVALAVAFQEGQAAALKEIKGGLPARNLI